MEGCKTGSETDQAHKDPVHRHYRKGAIKRKNEKHILICAIDTGPCSKDTAADFACLLAESQTVSDPDKDEDLAACDVRKFTDPSKERAFYCLPDLSGDMVEDSIVLSNVTKCLRKKDVTKV